MTILAVLLGAPLGLGGAVFMAKVAPKWLRDILKPAVGLYMAIPSVVYGFIGLTVVVPFVREFFHISTWLWPVYCGGHLSHYDFYPQ